MGHRSRVKDALAVMEKIPNPQSVKLTHFKCVNYFNIIEKFKQPKTLKLVFSLTLLFFYREIAMKFVENTHLRYDTLITNSYNNNSPKDEPEYESSFSGTSTKSAWFCTNCDYIFMKFSDYDFHLIQATQCAEIADPLEIQVYIKRIKIFTKTLKITMRFLKF